jgi:hypothetical protein
VFSNNSDFSQFSGREQTFNWLIVSHICMASFLPSVKPPFQVPSAICVFWALHNETCYIKNLLPYKQKSRFKNTEPDNPYWNQIIFLLSQQYFLKNSWTKGSPGGIRNAKRTSLLTAEQALSIISTFDNTNCSIQIFIALIFTCCAIETSLILSGTCNVHATGCKSTVSFSQSPWSNIVTTTSFILTTLSHSLRAIKPQTVRGWTPIYLHTDY